VMSVEIKDTSRPDVWNVEGLARALRGFLGLEAGLRKYVVGKPLVEIYVDERLRNIRPYIGCSIIRNLKLTDAMIRGFMHMQDKLDQSYGRNRQRTSIGLYDFELLASPLHYTVAGPTDARFVPLGFDQEMTLEDILKKHPKGLEYGHIVSKHSVFPILLDADKKVLSFPPVINSNDLGRITDKTENILVEVTGTDNDTVLNTVRLVTLSLIDRGGKAYSAFVHYPKEKMAVVTPDFQTREMDLHVDYVNQVLGLEMTAKQIAHLLPKAGLGVEKKSSDSVTAQVSSYRVDVMHEVDLIEDVAIAYGYNRIKPLWLRLPTSGRARPEREPLDVARELMVGLGFQEVFMYTLTNPENLYAKMNLKGERAVEIAEQKVQTLTCLRNWLLPSLMEFLGCNLSVEYPQRLFALDIVTVLDGTSETQTRDEYWLAAVVSYAGAGFTEIKSDLDAFFLNLGLEWQIKETNHRSFVEGRAGNVMVKGKSIGVLGEICPKVLVAWKLENPVAAFELNLQKILVLNQRRIGACRVAK
jgi:phenylalanyl-tRNA synthetase beta chain